MDQATNTGTDVLHRSEFLMSLHWVQPSPHENRITSFWTLFNSPLLSKVFWTVFHSAQLLCLSQRVNPWCAILLQRSFRRRSASESRATPPPPFAPKSPSRPAWQPSVNQRSSQTSGAPPSRPRLQLPSTTEEAAMLRNLKSQEVCVNGSVLCLSFSRTTRFASFPDHLVIQIKKFTFGLDWVPKKLGRHTLYMNCLLTFCW